MDIQALSGAGIMVECNDRRRNTDIAINYKDPHNSYLSFKCREGVSMTNYGSLVPTECDEASYPMFIRYEMTKNDV